MSKSRAMPIWPYQNATIREWKNIEYIESKSYICGYCSSKVASDWGWGAIDNIGRVFAHIYICPDCKMPTYFDPFKGQLPTPKLGNPIQYLPRDIEILYEEARNDISQKSYTSCVMICRKILMNIAVEKGADENKTFSHYIDYLDKNGFIPKNECGWVDKIRKKGNDANHEISIMDEEDAKIILVFTEMLLKLVYEFPVLARTP